MNALRLGSYLLWSRAKSRAVAGLSAIYCFSVVADGARLSKLVGQYLVRHRRDGIDGFDAR